MLADRRLSFYFCVDVLYTYAHFHWIVTVMPADMYVTDSCWRCSMTWWQKPVCLGHVYSNTAKYNVLDVSVQSWFYYVLICKEDCYSLSAYLSMLAANSRTESQTVQILAHWFPITSVSSSAILRLGSLCFIKLRHEMCHGL